jgi:endonuclease-3
LIGKNYTNAQSGDALKPVADSLQNMPKPSARSVHTVMRALARAIDDLDLPAVEKIAEESQEDPFEVLISTMLSAQTRDPVTAAASARLFRVARTPRTMARLTTRQIERLIYPVSFYRHKAKHVKETCRILVERFGGRVPGTMEELLTLPGVGRKTANLVLILSFKSLKNICVDTHVHRISNRLGWVTTRTPEETERALYDATERRWWPYINRYLVTWGQNVCRPVYPRCGDCVIAAHCPRVGLTRGAATSAPSRHPSAPDSARGTRADTRRRSARRVAV